LSIANSLSHNGNYQKYIANAFLFQELVLSGLFYFVPELGSSGQSRYI
jgi:hypothetical protein